MIIERFPNDSTCCMETARYLDKILPHGSGFDCDYEFSFYENGSIRVKSFFHVMDENGFYRGYQPFSFVLKYKSEKNGFEFGVLKFRERLSCMYGLREYIDECVYIALQDFIID